MRKGYYIQNGKGFFLTIDNEFVFVFPEKNIKEFETKDLAEIEILKFPKEKLIIRKYLNKIKG